jgi:putative cardiolipin synthase
MCRCAHNAGYACSSGNAVDGWLAAYRPVRRRLSSFVMAIEQSGEASGRGGQASVTSLWSPQNGLISRVDLIENARETLDAQYYEWTSDRVGTYLLDRVLRAADRGVHVRLLVDDLHIGSRTKAIAFIREHNNVDVRLYNPSQHRRNAVTRGLEFARRFRRLGRRMHNKLLIADGDTAIVGGRNIADPHFGLHDSMNLIDYDVLLVGAPVEKLCSIFDSYWASAATVQNAAATDSSDLSRARSDLAQRMSAQSDLNEVLDRIGEHQTDHRRYDVEGSDITVIADEPLQTETPLAVHQALVRAAGDARESVTIVTPFFVPGEADISLYKQWTSRGLDVRVLTNSLASNPGTIANSGYRKGRPGLLEAGLDLFELRADASSKDEWEIPPTSARLLGLHAKLYIIDGRRVILGSANLDPRSRRINTEMTITIESDVFAQDIENAVDGLIAPPNAWAVNVAADGSLTWVSDGGALTRQPARGVWQRIVDGVAGRLPIDEQL